MSDKEITQYHFYKKLKALHFIKTIYLFGSRAKDINDERADIDLAIDCPDATDKQWNQVLEIIKNADTLLLIDCVRFDRIKSQKFREAILKDNKVLFER